VRKVPLTIIGVLDRKGQNALGQDQDDIILMRSHRPQSCARPDGRKQKRIGSISVKTADGAT